MAAVIAGMTLLQLLQAGAAAGSAALAIERLVTDLKAKGHKPEDPVPPEHAHQALAAIEAISRPLMARAVVAVCGVDCRPGDALCNNYCNLAPQKGPMVDHPPLLP